MTPRADEPPPMSDAGRGVWAGTTATTRCACAMTVMGSFGIAFSLPDPGSRAGTLPSSNAAIHCCHSGHQDPGRISAFASHSSGFLGNLFMPGLVQ